MRRGLNAPPAVGGLLILRYVANGGIGRGFFSFSRILASTASNRLHHLTILEAEHAQASGFEELLTNGVVFSRLFMDRPVQLDNQPCLRAIEVHDKSVDGVLPAELEPSQPAIA